MQHCSGSNLILADSIYEYWPELSNTPRDQTLGQFPAFRSKRTRDGFGSRLCEKSGRSLPAGRTSIFSPSYELGWKKTWDSCSKHSRSYRLSPTDTNGHDFLHSLGRKKMSKQFWLCRNTAGTSPAPLCSVMHLRPRAPPISHSKTTT